MNWRIILRFKSTATSESRITSSPLAFGRRVGKRRTKKRIGIQAVKRKAGLQLEKIAETRLKSNGPLKAPTPKNMCNNPRPIPFLSPEISMKRPFTPPSNVPTPIPMRATATKRATSFLPRMKPMRPAVIDDAPARRKGFFPKKSDATPADTTAMK